MFKIRSYSKTALVACMIGAVFTLISPALVSADGEQNTEQYPRAQVEPTLDPRLPAVIPGQEVIRNGKKIKVWSTGGSPSVGANYQQPQDWTDSGLADNPSIIIDGRQVHAPHRDRK